MPFSPTQQHSTQKLSTHPVLFLLSKAKVYYTGQETSYRFKHFAYRINVLHC